MRRPPRWADKFLEWYCNPELLEDLQGDLHERFDRRLNRRGVFIARLMFVVDVVSFFRPYTIRRTSRKGNPLIMIKPFFTIAVRLLLKRRLYSIINISGLALGMTAALFLLSYVSFELSYDKFHDKLSNIYMVRLDTYQDGALDVSSMASYYAEAPALKELYPQVENFARLHHASGMLSYQATNGEAINYFEHNSFYADSSFFTVFSFPLVLGDKNSVLKNSNSMLMSESAAKKYFGSENPIGKVIKLSTGWEGGEFVVEGVFKDIPENSHIRFDFLFAIERLLNNQQFKYGGWYWENFITYLLLKPNTDFARLESGLADLIEANTEFEYRNTSLEKKPVLVPLAEFHLYSSIVDERNGNYKLVYFIMIVACLVLGTAWLNYLNLSTAAAVRRLKELGLRKVMGSRRGELIQLFLVESVVISAIAIVITGLLLIIMNGYFTELAGKQIITDVIGQGSFWLIVAAVLVTGIFFCGFYPGVIMSSIQAFTVLKGMPLEGKGGEFARKVMVVFQFVASILLIAATLTIGEQIAFMRNQQAGIETKQKLILRAPGIVSGSRLNSIDGFKNLLMQHPSVKSVASSSEVPGRYVGWAKEFRMVQQSDKDKVILHIVSVDEDFAATYGLPILAGRNFSDKTTADFGKAVLLNETALKKLGIKDAESAIGQEVIDFEPQRIVGVVKDYQQLSLKYANLPIVFQFIPWDNSFLTISLDSRDLQADVELVTESFKKTFPGNAVEYYFLDDYMNQVYKADEQFWNIFKVFSALTIFISCLGLFGLSSFVIARRTKEIGIRKVLGSSVLGIARLLSFDFLKLVVIAFVAAVPLIMTIMNQWLESFALRISIPLWIYVSSGAAAVIVAMITISWLAIKAALAPPVDAIKSE